MKKPVLTMIGAAALLAAVVAFHGVSTGPSLAAEGKSIVIGARLVPETIDPAHSSNANNDFYIAALYDRVVGFSTEGELVPAIATSWKYSDDAKSLTLAIRDGVVFHSGNKLTAKDVAYSLDRLIGIAAGTGGLVTDYERSDVASDTELTLHLKQPNVNFVRALAAVYVVDSALVTPNEGVDKGQKWLSVNDAGSGPYSLKSYNANQQVAYAQVPNHWTGIANRPDELTIRIITEASAIRDEVRAGGIDFGYGVPTIDLPSFEKDENFTVQRHPSTRVTLGMMNMQGKVTSDPRVREAIQLAYDQKGHVKAAMGGYGEIATSLVPASMACRQTVEPYEPDIERAKRLVEEAGAAGATLRIAYQPVIPEQRVGGTLLEAALRQIGFNVEVQPVTFPQYLASIKSPETMADVAIFWDIAPYPSIGPMLTRTWASDRIGVSNFGRYSNPEVDRLLSEGTLATDPDKACEAFKKAQQLIIDDRPTIIIGFPTVNHVYNKKIAKVLYSPIAQTFDLTLLTLAE